MKNKTIPIITSVVTLIPLFVGLILWNVLPERLSISFDFDGTANEECDKALAVLGLPLFIFICHIFCIYMSAHDPKKQNISDKEYGIAVWICPIGSIIAGTAIYTHALNVQIPLFPIIQAVFGIGLIIIGNYLPKNKQNRTLGIRLPWTLNDNENWNRTHRFAGKIWIIAGLLMIVNAFFGNAIVTIGILLLVVLTPIIYSFVYHNNHG